MSRLFLGVDGGQSSTTALIADQSGRVLGSGRGGPCNHVGAAEGRAKFTGAIIGCLAAACAQAGLDPAGVRFEAACLGFSGGAEDKEAILRELLRVERLLVTTDALIALSGATAGEPGIITIAGTGSISFGRGRHGRTARAGGWGYVFGDEGGAFDLARQALRAILRHEEGWGPRTALTAKLLEATGGRSANDLMHRFYTTEFPRPRIASFAPLVDECARAGDHVAHRLLENAARDLAGIASAVRGQLFAAGEPVPVAYVGGVFRSAVLLERFRLLVELTEGCRVAAPLYSPAAGALIDALAAGGLKPKLSNVPGREK
jgi:N-acetylglucosamine kinase-like BadF-type ATPase